MHDKLLRVSHSTLVKIELCQDGRAPVIRRRKTHLFTFCNPQGCCTIDPQRLQRGEQRKHCRYLFPLLRLTVTVGGSLFRTACLEDPVLVG